MTRLYADHNATSPLHPDARDAMQAALGLCGNPSSIHAEGRTAKRMLEDAREALANVLECSAERVTFTSGATEGLHIALESASAMDFDRVLVSAVEHDAVWAQVFKLWPDAEILPVDQHARIDADALEASLRAGSGRPLVIAQAANNETGTLQPIERLSTLSRAAGGAILVDGVQAFGKRPVGDLLGVADWLVVSSHKIGGPLGAGAIVTAPGIEIMSRRTGGGQERGARAGTENVPAIAGFAAAAKAVCGDAAVAGFAAQTSHMRDGFERVLAANLAADALTIIARDVPRLPNTACIALTGWDAAKQVIALDLAGAAVSAGSACSSGKVKRSRILEAAGLGAATSGEAIRASFGWTNDASDGERLANLLLQAASRRARTLSPQAA